MTEATTLTPFLSESEVDQLCAPLKQRQAQARRLCALLNVESLPRRPDGFPLVGRKMVEERLNAKGEARSHGAFSWSK